MTTEPEQTIEVGVERMNLVHNLLTAAQQWRASLIPNTSTGTQPEMRRLMDAVAAFDRKPCDHPRGWRVFSSQLADADELCGYCGSILVDGYTAPDLPDDLEGDAKESSYARHPSTQEPSSPPES